MGRCFEYRDYEIERMCEDLVRRLIDAKKPIPPKIKKHCVSIRFRTGEGCFSYPNYGWFSHLPEFKSWDDAEKFLGKLPDMFRMKPNFWVEEGETRTYETKDGARVLYHYEIHEYDYEEYEDGEYHTEYTPEEIERMKETLKIIDKARVYMKAYDYACDECDFGGGSFDKVMDEHLTNYEEIDFNNLEQYIEDYDDD